MPRFSRRASALAAIAAGAMLMTACGGGSGSSDQNSLSIFIGAQTNYPQAYSVWTKDITAKFKAKTGADLTIETFASSGEETTKIQSSIVSNSGPDVYMLGSTFTPVAYATKGFVTLSDADWAKIGGRERFIPETLGMSGPDNANQIGVPASMAPYTLAYNTRMFDAAGITSAPTTWDELVSTAKKLSNPSAGVYGAALDYADSYDPWKYIWAMTEQSGGHFVSPDLKTAGLNSPQTVGAVSGYFDLLTKYQISDPKSVGWKSSDALAAFASGKAAMLPMTSASAIPTLEKSSIKGDYAFAQLPTVPLGMTERPAGAQEAASIVSGQNYSIASYSKKKDLALSFIDMMTSPDEQMDFYQKFGALPSNQEAMKQLSVENKLLAPLLEIEGSSTPTAFTGAWADFQNGVTNVVVQSLPSLARGSYDGAAVKSLLDKANTGAQSALDRASR